MKIGFITFTNNIENIYLDKDEKFHIFIGKVPKRFWYSIKIFKNESKINYADDLICFESGAKFSGNYFNRNIHTISFVKHSNSKYPKFVMNKGITRIPVQ